MTFGRNHSIEILLKFYCSFKHFTKLLGTTVHYVWGRVNITGLLGKENVKR